MMVQEIDNDDDHIGRPSEVDNHLLTAVVEDLPHTTVVDMPEELGITTKAITCENLRSR